MKVAIYLRVSMLDQAIFVHQNASPDGSIKMRHTSRVPDPCVPP